MMYRKKFFRVKTFGEYMNSYYTKWNGAYLTLLISVILPVSSMGYFTGVERETCMYRQSNSLQPLSVHKTRLQELRDQMLIHATIEGPEIDAYIIPSFDEHQNEEVAERDRRLQYLSGFNRPNGMAVITMKHAAIWADARYLQQANGELNCDWYLFRADGNISITDWIGSQLKTEMRIGADPHLIPFFMWREWLVELYDKYSLKLVKVNKNLIDIIWGSERPSETDSRIRVHQTKYAGEKWQSKITTLRSTLRNIQCDAIVITSLTEIAYILNIRGRDIPFTPVFKSYVVVSQDKVVLYTNTTKLRPDVELHLQSEICYSDLCVNVKDYEAIWRDIRTFSQIWKKVLIPAQCVYDLGASEAIFSAFNRKIVEIKISPIIYMKAQKNDVERAGMRMAHIKDGAAMCDAMNYLEERFSSGEKWTELKVKREVERSLKLQDHSQGLSFDTIVAFGPHASLPHYTPSNVTDIDVANTSTLIIDSGGQYLEGTTDVTRTYHFGQPTEEEKKAYTSVLAGIIKLSSLKFPENIWPSEIDVFSRSPVWDSMSDYPHGTGHGIGSHLSVHESPIDISYAAKKQYHFKEGYFFSNEPGYYRKEIFGVRLENVLEVVDTGYKHPSGMKFLAFKEISLVPYEPKLIDRTLLSAQELELLLINLMGPETVFGVNLKRCELYLGPYKK